MSAYSIFLFGFRLVGIIKTSRLFYLRYPAPKLPVHSGQLVSLLHRFWVDDWQQNRTENFPKPLTVLDYICFFRHACFGNTRLITGINIYCICSKKRVFLLSNSLSISFIHTIYVLHTTHAQLYNNQFAAPQLTDKQ